MDMEIFLHFNTMAHIPETPANDNNFERGAQSKESTSKVANDVDLKRLHKVADHLEEITDDKTFKKEAEKFADDLATALENNNSMIHKLYKKFRHGWDKLPRAAQWAILIGEEKIPVAPPVFNSLIEAGLIRYRGETSPEKRDEALNEKRVWEQKKQKWGARIAAIFAPEIIEFLPVIDLLHRFQNSKAKVFEVIRHRMDALKIENVTHGKETRVMDEAA